MQEHETRQATSHLTPRQRFFLLPQNNACGQSESSAPIMKPLCHKTNASQECCCDTCALLTQGLNIELLTHTSAAKRAGALTAAAPVGHQFCIYLSTLLGCVLAASQQSSGLSKDRPLSDCSQVQHSVMIHTGDRHNTLQQIASHVWSSTEVTGCVCVCWMSCGADLWLGAGAEGSAGVQHRFIIHASLCTKWWHRAAFFSKKDPSACMFFHYFHSTFFSKCGVTEFERRFIYLCAHRGWILKRAFSICFSD